MHSVRWAPPVVALLMTIAGSVAQAAGPEPAATTLCAACHGERGRSVAPEFPNLAGQHAEYLQKQLGDFASGRRTNEVMSAVLAQVPRSEFPALVVHHAAELPARGTIGDAALVAAGRTLFEEGDWPAGIPPCRSCHGERGAGGERYPRLAGQNAAYTLQQLADFKSGTRRNDPRRMMREVASRLGEVQMKALAEYLAGL